MFSLIYRSTSITDFNDMDIRMMMEKSRIFNEKNKMNKKSLKASTFLVICRESALLKAIICKKIKTTLKRAWFPNHGDRDRIRTCDRLLRRSEK